MGEAPGLHRLAHQLLDATDDPVVRVRLWRDVLGLAADPAPDAAAGPLDAHPQVRALLKGQWPDGSWGRLHSQDTTARQRIPTTEVGVARALALGLAPSHPALRRAADHLAAILNRAVVPRDPPERNPRWPIGVALFAAATLARLRPLHGAVERVRRYWRQVALEAFAAGAHDPVAEEAAHRRLTGVAIRGGYLTLRNRYALALLSGGTEPLPAAVTETWLSWLAGLPDGLGYLNVPLWPSGGPAAPSQIDRRLASWELLAAYPGWRAVARPFLDWLGSARLPDGGWDLGPRWAGSTLLPLSADWRRRDTRRRDWTVRVLLLLARAGESRASVY